ncbi:MAG TPA: hypothetical protein VNP72_04295, partial [Longimicrobium sp.]|nr:hypothetical protein [Longimicrobium sp.]
DADAAFTLAYQAALQAATAVVRAAGYRVKGEGHHHYTFAALAALGLDAVSAASRDLNVIRQRRHAAIYDWQAKTSEQDLAFLRAATARLFAAGRGWLILQRLSLASLPPLPPSAG